MVSTATALNAPSAAVIVTLVADATFVVLIVKGRELVEPAGTITVAGTLATRGLELVRVRDVLFGTEPLSVALFWVD
jgi:hypothetical protein